MFDWGWFDIVWFKKIEGSRNRDSIVVIGQGKQQYKNRIADSSVLNRCYCYHIRLHQQIFPRLIFVQKLGLETGLRMFIRTFKNHKRNKARDVKSFHADDKLVIRLHKGALTINILNLIKWSGVRNLRNILIGVDETACVKRGKKPDLFNSFWLLTAQIP